MTSTPPDTPPKLTAIVEKRDGSKVPYDHSKLIRRISLTFISEHNEGKRQVLAARLARLVLEGVAFPVASVDLERGIVEAASQLIIEDPAYADTAASVELEGIYRNTEIKFSMAMLKAEHLLTTEFMELVRRHRRSLDGMIREGRDSLLSFLALRTLQSTYFLKDGQRIYERPQYTWLRTALFVHGDDLSAVRRTYDMISSMKFMPGSPILFNSGTRNPQLSSCFLISAGSKVEEIFDVLAQAANVSQGGGGIGLGLGSLPCQGRTRDGASNPGLIPILKMFDASADVVEKACTSRPSAITTYIEPWHAEVIQYVRTRRVSGGSGPRTERLFNGLWVNDLFMKRVDEDENWTLFCPSDAPTLTETFGEEFEMEYERLEDAGLGRKSIRARDLWKEIIISQIESGGPFIMFKDSVNERSNERYIGTISQSNLCTEIVQYCDEGETAVCNLASVVLPSFVRKDGAFDFAAMDIVVRQMVLFLNCVIGRTESPSAEASRSIQKHRAIGIGIQGLADTFARMRLPFDSDEASRVNVEIAESIYFSSVDESCNLITVFGTHPSFHECPSATGWLQFHHYDDAGLTSRYNWTRLHDKMMKGMANSLLVAYMPTAGTSQLTGCSECFEPYNSMIFTRKLNSGQFVVVPEPLMDMLRDLDLWRPDIVNTILAREGSVQSLDIIPKRIREVFKTVWELDPEVLVRMAAARAPFICQSQSMSLYFAEPTLTNVSKAVFLAWRLGLKTGLYYLRTKPASRPQPISLPTLYWPSSDGGPSCISCTA